MEIQEVQQLAYGANNLANRLMRRRTARPVRNSISECNATNIGAVPALDVQLRSPDGHWQRIGDMGLRHEEERSIPLRVSPGTRLTLVLRYGTVLGEVLEDTYRLNFASSSQFLLFLQTKTIVDGHRFEIV